MTSLPIGLVAGTATKRFQPGCSDGVLPLLCERRREELAGRVQPHPRPCSSHVETMPMRIELLLRQIIEEEQHPSQ